ncbi:MAG: histidine kinase [Spongiibacteraceae bacterium]
MQADTENLAMFVEQVPVAAAMFDRNMCYIAASRRWRGDYGLGDRPLIGVCQYDVFPEVPERWRAVLQRGLAGESAEGEDRFDRIDGSMQWLRWEVQPWYSNKEIGGIFIITEDVTAKKSVAMLEQRVDQRTLQLRELAFEITRSEESERRAIARDLHDGLGQILAIAKIRLDTLRQQITAPELLEMVDAIEKLIAQGSRSVRSLSAQLSPALLYDVGLAAAVKWLAGEIEREHGLKIYVTEDESAKPLEQSVRIILFRAIRELLINVVKHANAEEVYVEISMKVAHNSHKNAETHLLEVIVSDNGHGFDPQQLQTQSYTGFGLRSVRERLAFIGGQMDIDTAPGRGTTVALLAPLQKAAQQN